MHTRRTSLLICNREGGIEGPSTRCRHPPNLDSVEWLVDELWEKIQAGVPPQTELHLYGAYGESAAVRRLHKRVRIVSRDYASATAEQYLAHSEPFLALPTSLNVMRPCCIAYRGDVQSSRSPLRQR